MAKTQKLNQVIAVEQATKARTQAEVTELYKLVQKPVLFQGHAKTYNPNSETGEQFPPESNRVQNQALDTVRQVANKLTDLFDITVTKDVANTSAKADVVVDGQTILSQVPATSLLFLEKQLTDVHTFVKALPVLDPARDWTLDKNSGLHKTEVTKSARTNKVQRPIVLLAPTAEHPGQASLITEDQIVGYWNTVHMSGALATDVKASLVARVEKLQRAVKVAREEANCVEAPQQAVGEKVFNYIVGS